MSSKFKDLIIAKALFFCTSMSGVGWNRFQNIYFLNKGFSPSKIGMLKSIGLVLKVFGEPLWCCIADLTDTRLVFALCMLMQVVTMEMLRVITPLTFLVVVLIKLLRTTTAPSSTLTTTTSFKVL